MKHPLKPENYKGSLAELATELGDLRYDALQEFLVHLANKIKQDGDADLNRGRTKLANRLYQAATHLQTSSDEIKVAWDISEPYMPKE